MMSLNQRCATLLFLAIAIPIATWRLLPALPLLGRLPEPYSGGRSYPATELKFDRLTVGPEPVGFPLITNVQIHDFNGDGTGEVLACDASRQMVALYTARSSGKWMEQVLARDIPAPAHVTVVDIDGDSDLDFVVSVLGNLLPDDKRVGRVELFERTESGYVRHVILNDVRRVADAQPGDFDGDGDVDLAIAVFGYSHGEVLWLENRGDLKFRDHRLLLNAPGTIHVPVGDYDGDGDPDIAAIVSQDEEELWGFENLGGGEFRSRRLWMTFNPDLGSAGLVKDDLDQDGDIDLILPAGDNLEDQDAYPQPYHGCLWFENKGDWTFAARRIAELGGTYAAAVGDLDGDGDRDVVLVSMTNDWLQPDRASVAWLENDGSQNFRTWQIDTDPLHLVTVAVGDLDGDGRDDIVAGGLNLRRPYERIGRIAAWLNRGRRGP